MAQPAWTKDIPMAPDMAPNHTLTSRQESILSYIADTLRERGFPPSVREIGEAVGLTSPSTVHSHLATLQKHGFCHLHINIIG